MNEEKLIQLITTQNEIIDMLLREYISVFRSPYDKEKILELQDTLKSLQKELKL